MMLLLRWIASAAAVAVAAWAVPGIRLEEGIVPLLTVALILGLVNALVRPLLRALSCGVIVLTLGLFLLVINAAMLLLAAWISRLAGIGFEVDGFGAALVGSIIISLVSYLFSLLLPGNSAARAQRVIRGK
jgi:putative membrane protein